MVMASRYVSRASASERGPNKQSLSDELAEVLRCIRIKLLLLLVLLLLVVMVLLLLLSAKDHPVNVSLMQSLVVELVCTIVDARLLLVA